MNRKELQALSRIRLAEARALLGSGHFSGAYYLAGYAMECAFKACIARQTLRHDFPDKKRVDASYTHNLKELVAAAELRGATCRCGCTGSGVRPKLGCSVEVVGAQSL